MSIAQTTKETKIICIAAGPGPAPRKCLNKDDAPPCERLSDAPPGTVKICQSAFCKPRLDPSAPSANAPTSAATPTPAIVETPTRTVALMI